MPFIFTLTPYGSLQKSQDYKLQVNVLVEDIVSSGIFQNVFTQIFFPDNTGTIQMDVATIVDAYLEYFTPKLSLQKPVACPEQSKRYKITYQLQLGDSLVTDLLNTVTYYAIKGGLAYQEWNPVTFFTQNIISNKQGLQFPAEAENVSREQPLFFSWLYPYDDNADQYITYACFYDDNTDTIISNLTPVNSNKWSVCTAPLGLTRIGQVSPPGKTLVYFYCVVYAEGNIMVAQSPNYYVDHRTFYDCHYLLYRNSLGALSSIRLRGQVDMEADYVLQQATRINPASYFANFLLPQTVQPANEETIKNTGDTGFISKAAVNTLRGLFLSKQVIEWIDYQYLPVNSTTLNAKLYTNKNSLFSLQIQWQYAFTNQFYTPAATVPEAPACPAVEIFKVVQVNKNTLQIVYSLQVPYDRIKIVINGDDDQTYIYTGNTGSILQPFANPATTAPVNINVTAQTLCNEDTNPVSAGPFAIVSLSVYPNSKPVAVNDTCNLNGGFNTAVLLPVNILANDYDPDGDAIQAIPASGATSMGGSYSITADGKVNYQPPSSSFTGQDHIGYYAQEVADPSQVSNLAVITINVGSGSNPVINVYVRIKQKITNTYNYGSSSGNSGTYTLYFFSDVNGNAALDVTDLGVVVNVQKNQYGDFASTTNLTFNGIGTFMQIYNGTFRHTDNHLGGLNYTITETLQPGTGYTVIP